MRVRMRIYIDSRLLAPGGMIKFLKYISDVLRDPPSHDGTAYHHHTSLCPNPPYHRKPSLFNMSSNELPQCRAQPSKVSTWLCGTRNFWTLLPWRSHAELAIV